MIIRYIAFVAYGSILFMNASEQTLVTHVDEFGNTALHYAMRRGVTANPRIRYKYMDAICALLYANAALHEENADGLTPSEFATCHDTADGYSLPLTQREDELYTQGKFSDLYGEWLHRNNSNKYAAWSKAYEKFKNKTVRTAVSPHRTESPPVSTRHKKVKSADTDTSYSAKRTASMPVTSTTAPSQIPAIVVTYEG